MTNITPCSLGNSCCEFGFLISIIPERSFLYHSLYILIEKSSNTFAPSELRSPGLFLSLSLFHFFIIDSVPPGSGPLKDTNSSSVHGIFQTRILEWVAIPSSRGSSQPRDQTRVASISCIAGGFFTSESSGKSPDPIL